MEHAPETGSARRLEELRLIALAEIAAGDTGMDAKSYVKELRLIEAPNDSIPWLEAAVMLAVVSRTRPRLTLRRLRRLRKLYEAQGTPSAFEQLDDRINRYLYPARLTNHGYSTHNFEHIEHDAVWAQVSAHLSSLKANGYDVFLNSGTLLGVIREGKLIGHDDDIDLAVVLKAQTPKAAAQEWQALRGVLEELGLFHSEVEESKAIYKLTPAGSVEIDLFPAWSDGSDAYVYPHTPGTLATRDMLPLQPCELNGQAIPASPERMLASNYGDDWRTPDPFFKFNWSHANRLFADFLEELT